MNSFGNIEWLPEAGLKPDQVFYSLDGWAEAMEIFFSTDENLRSIYLELSREKLAEVVEMSRRELFSEAQIATREYLEYLKKIDRRNIQVKDAPQINSDFKLLNVILEHRYILGIEYPELPKATRRKTIRKIDRALNSMYSEIENRLPTSLKDSLFFKKDEINWIWEIATDSDRKKP